MQYSTYALSLQRKPQASQLTADGQLINVQGSVIPAYAPCPKLDKKFPLYIYFDSELGAFS
jgi:hypothetical protein